MLRPKFSLAARSCRMSHDFLLAHTGHGLSAGDAIVAIAKCNKALDPGAGALATFTRQAIWDVHFWMDETMSEFSSVEVNNDLLSTVDLVKAYANSLALRCRRLVLQSCMHLGFINYSLLIGFEGVKELTQVVIRDMTILMCC